MGVPAAKAGEEGEREMFTSFLGILEPSDVKIEN